MEWSGQGERVQVADFGGLQINYMADLILAAASDHATCCSAYLNNVSVVGGSLHGITNIIIIIISSLKGEWTRDE